MAAPPIFNETLWDKPNSQYEHAIEQLCKILEGYTPETIPWMTAIFHNWFHVEPHPWQIENAIHLCQNMDVFLTSQMGSGKSMLTMVPVIACQVLKRPHIAIIVYPTVELMADQVRMISKGQS
jgi:ATP-dependent helicase YprA (DUF1998 family)